MATLILTVPHSGSFFLFKFLVAVLGLRGDMSSAQVITPESKVDFSHAHAKSSMVLPEGVYDSVIVTLRHPHKSCDTGKLMGTSADQIAHSWDSLNDRLSQYKTKLFLAIDGPEENRFPQLMAIAEHFGKKDLEAEVKKYADAWEPVNKSPDVEGALAAAVELYEGFIKI